MRRSHCCAPFVRRSYTGKRTTRPCRWDWLRPAAWSNDGYLRGPSTGLECISILRVETAEQNPGRREGDERLMQIGAPLVAHPQPTEPVVPGAGPLHVPAVPAQALAGLDPDPRDPAADMMGPAVAPAVRLVIRLVGVHLRWPPPGSAGLTERAAERGDRLEHLLEDDRVVHIGRRQERGQRESLAIDHQMAFRARLAAIRWIRPGRLAPLFAGTLVESTLARDQSIWSASPRRWSSTRSSRRHTPAACQSRSRRQQVLPLPQPSSAGRSDQGQPLRRMKRMPANALRSGIRGRPPRAWEGGGGSRGATSAHSSSGTIQAMLTLPQPRVVST